MPSPTAAPLIDEQDDTDVRDEQDRPWNVVVWNDPVTLMSYVVFVLRKLFGFSDEKATHLMMQVHEDGKAIVSSGSRDEAEIDVHRLHANGLQATLMQD